MRIRSTRIFVFLISVSGLYAMDEGKEIADALGRTTLHQAAFAGDMDQLTQSLLTIGTQPNKVALVNQADKLGRTALHYAAKGGFLEGVRMLLQWQASPNVSDSARIIYEKGCKHKEKKNALSAGYSPLDFAVMHGHAKIAQELIRTSAIKRGTLRRALANALYARKYTPISGKQEFELWDAIDTCYYRILQSGKLYPKDSKEYADAYTYYLYDKPVDAIEFYAEQYPVHNAVSENDIALCKELIADLCYPCDSADECGNTPLLYAAKNNNYDLVKFLLEEGATKHLNHALWLAALWGSQEIIPTQEEKENMLRQKELIFELLLEYGADINSVIHEKTKYTLLHQAVEDDEPAAVANLLDYGAVVDSIDITRRTPLYYALKNQRYDIANLLLEAGANINYQNEETGYTLLHHAVEENESELVGVLLSYGAKTNILDAQGRTSCELAMELDHATVGRLLTKRADIKQRSRRRSDKNIILTRSLDDQQRRSSI